MAKPILFCDFDGVLCNDRYWRSLPEAQYKKVQELLLRNDVALVNDWMRGNYSAEEINQIISEKTRIPFEQLWDTFVEDSKTMRVSKEVLETLHNLRAKYTVILITDNMDSFSRFTQPSLGLSNYFDHISNSFYEGVHKTDNSGQIFKKYADKYGIPIQNCVALDNSRNVQRVFTELGGRFFLVTPSQDISFHLAAL